MAAEAGLQETEEGWRGRGGAWRPPDRGLEGTVGGPGWYAKVKLWPLSQGDRDH